MKNLKCSLMFAIFGVLLVTLFSATSFAGRFLEVSKSDLSTVPVSQTTVDNSTVVVQKHNDTALIKKAANLEAKVLQRVEQGKLDDLLGQNSYVVRLNNLDPQAQTEIIELVDSFSLPEVLYPAVKPYCTIATNLRGYETGDDYVNDKCITSGVFGLRSVSRGVDVVIPFSAGESIQTIYDRIKSVAASMPYALVSDEVVTISDMTWDFKKFKISFDDNLPMDVNLVVDGQSDVNTSVWGQIISNNLIGGWMQINIEDRTNAVAPVYVNQEVQRLTFSSLPVQDLDGFTFVTDDGSMQIRNFFYMSDFIYQLKQSTFLTVTNSGDNWVEFAFKTSGNEAAVVLNGFDSANGTTYTVTTVNEGK